MINYIIFICFSSLLFKGYCGTKCAEIDYGSQSAPVQIIEYASPSCTICSQFSQTILPKLYPYIRSKKIMLRVVNLPYNMIDLKACTLISQSPDPKEFNTLVYQHQNDWLLSKDPVQSLGAFLEKKGMPRAQIKNALKNVKRENKIIKERVLAEKKYNIQAIPLLIIGQKQIIGLMPWDKLKIVIEEAIQHVAKGNPIETFGQNDQTSKRKTRTPKKRNSIEG